MNRTNQQTAHDNGSHPRTPGYEGRVSGKKGFTLIELMIVIMMFGILSAIAYPSLGKWKMNMAIKGSSRDVLFAIKTARMKAINSNSPVEFKLDAVTGDYSVEDKNTGDAYVSDNIGEFLTVVNNNLGNTVEFNSKGMPSKTGTFEFQTVSGESFRTIELYLTGIAKLH